MHQKRNPIKILFSKTFCNPALSVCTSVYNPFDSNKRQNSTNSTTFRLCVHGYWPVAYETYKNTHLAKSGFDQSGLKWLDIPNQSAYSRIDINSFIYVLSYKNNNISSKFEIVLCWMIFILLDVYQPCILFQSF